MKGAIVLCSGGLDSVVTANYVKKRLNYGRMAILFFNYGQKSLKAERKFSKKCARKLKAEFIEIKLEELKRFSNSLINKKGRAKTMRKEDLKDSSKESKKWYVSARNTIFISYALALADFLFIKNNEINDIFLGFKCEGKEHYPDTTQKYISLMNKLSSHACSRSFKIKTPLIRKDKEDIILIGNKLGVNFKDTFSCYSGNYHCGKCLACMLRKKGFYWANIADPTKYKKN